MRDTPEQKRARQGRYLANPAKREAMNAQRREKRAAENAAREVEAERQQRRAATKRIAEGLGLRSWVEVADLYTQITGEPMTRANAHMIFRNAMAKVGPELQEIAAEYFEEGWTA